MSLSLILLISLVRFHVFIASYRVIPEKKSEAYQNTCVPLFVHLFYIFTNPRSWKNNFKKEASVCRHMDPEGCKWQHTFWITNFSFNFETEMSVLKNIPFNTKMLKKTLFMLYLYLLTCLAFISKGMLKHPANCSPVAMASSDTSNAASLLSKKGEISHYEPNFHD